MTTKTTLAESFSRKSLDSRLRTALRTKYGGGSQFGDTSCILLDNSGSMAGNPLRQLNEVADNFMDCRRFKFSSGCEELKPAERIPDVEGGTNMAHAFLHVKSLRIEHVVLITDGEPNDESAALRAAKDLRIDVFYIGPDPAPEFLRKLCQATGGQYGRADIARVLELTARVKERLQIAAPKSTIAL